MGCADNRTIADGCSLERCLLAEEKEPSFPPACNLLATLDSLPQLGLKLHSRATYLPTYNSSNHCLVPSHMSLVNHHKIIINNDIFHNELFV